MKSYTDIKQSAQLALLLPAESADMWWPYYYDVISDTGEYDKEPMLHKPISDTEHTIPCWSLVALLEVLPEGVIRPYYAPYLQKEDGKYHTAYGSDELLCEADNPVDACYEMILKLYKQKLL